jgi:hypothetical protein
MTDDLGLKIALVLAVGTALVALVGWWRARGWMARGNRARQRIARAGEDDAELLLAELGFVVVDRQVTHTWQMIVDGEVRDVRCRADLVVRLRRDRGARYVAEVKTGDRATEPTCPATRRQLLEYAMAFDVDGVLLLDMDQRRVRTVAFPRI